MATHYRALLLDGLAIHPHLRWVADQYDSVLSTTSKKLAPHHINLRRWSYIYELIGAGESLLDVGIGNGEFVNAAAHGKQFAEVFGMDLYERKDLQKIGDWTFISHSLDDSPQRRCRADIVTCMECIEHIKSPQFDQAIKNLKLLARKRMIVTVPFMEREPLPPYHHQSFDVRRLKRLFPDGKITLLMVRNVARWAMVDCHLA